MAVYERTYRGYSGPRAEAWSRLTVITRYAFREVFASRLFTGFFFACLIWPLACAVVIYLKYNIEALSILQLDALDLVPIDTTFFRFGVLRPQTFMAFLLILIVGPALISPDLRNAALPLYLSRPLSKTDYVLGKLLVVLILGSAVTWVPGLLLFAFQAYLAEGWLLDHLPIAVAIFFGSWVWILTLSIFSLAVSAWVKWKPWARIAFLGLMFISSAIGTTFKLIYDSWWGSLLVFDDLVRRIWDQMFAVEPGSELPVAAAWMALLLFTGVCLLALYQRIRAFEVVS